MDFQCTNYKETWTRIPNVDLRNAPQETRLDNLGRI